MKQLNYYIQEKLKVSSKSKVIYDIINYEDLLSDNNIKYKVINKNDSNIIEVNIDKTSDFGNKLSILFDDIKNNDQKIEEIKNTLNKYIEDFVKDNTELSSQDYNIKLDINYNSIYIGFIYMEDFNDKNDTVLSSIQILSPTNKDFYDRNFTKMGIKLPSNAEERMNNFYLSTLSYIKNKFYEKAEELIASTFNLLLENYK